MDYNLADGSYKKIQVSSSPNHYRYVRNACIGKYNGKDAWFVLKSDYSSLLEANSVIIYEIKSHLAPIQHFRLYRADSQGNTIMLADGLTETSFTDTTWNNASAGEYRFGISEVYYNGVESEII